MRATAAEPRPSIFGRTTHLGVVTLLIVEDDPVQCEVLEAIFVEAGSEVVIGTPGRLIELVKMKGGMRMWTALRAELVQADLYVGDKGSLSMPVF